MASRGRHLLGAASSDRRQLLVTRSSGLLDVSVEFFLPRLFSTQPLRGVRKGGAPFSQEKNPNPQ